MKKVFNLSLFFILLLAPFFTSAANNSDVLINEIAWMGSINSANDEWMELFNNTDNAIDLSGWILKSADDLSTSSGQAKLKINLKNVIPSKGFYLLERTDDNSVLGITADLIYTGALNNNGQDLKLYDSSNNLIDQVNHITGWLFGDNATKQTMEKSSTGWQTSQNPNGTPKAQNSLVPPQTTNAVTEIDTTQNANTINPTSNTLTPAPESGVRTGPTPSIIYPNGIIINEILPSPEGSDETNEYVELYNTNDFDVDLTNWKLQDIKGTVTTYIFPKNTTLLSYGYLILKRPETKITLNNDGDTLNLILPNENIIDSMFYISAPKNQSYNKIKSNWQWSTILTPGAVNIIALNSPKEITKTLPRPDKTDNNKTDGRLGTASISDTMDLAGNEISSGSNPWFLFLIALAITIISAIIILILKLKLKGLGNITPKT